MRKLNFLLLLLFLAVEAGANVPFGKPQFGGTEWTWNTANNKFEADGKEPTANPQRENSRGPVYKFENVDNVTTNNGVDTSDHGGIWVIGNTSNVTANLGNWAGSILIEDDAVATVKYSIDLKGTEAEENATVWTNGTLTFQERTDFRMNDGQNQRWYIGEKGVINTSFTQVTKGNRNWDIQVVVADAPERDDATRTMTTIRKKVMTWGADISSNINSITVWYKDADGNLNLLDNATAVFCDATGITISYEGWGYDEKTPSLPEGQFIRVSKTKADFLTPATAADDNEHWYLLTQIRGNESPVYDNGNAKLKRAAANTNLNIQPIAGNEKYLIRFFKHGEEDGLYDIQFATGNFITYDLTTGSYALGGIFNLYNINEEATHIGWNKKGFTDRVDNNGAGNNLAYWGSGKVTELNGNNDWSIYPVDFIDAVSISYTLHSNELNEDYKGTYLTGWNGSDTALPELVGVNGYKLTEVQFSENNGTYSLTADITFPFPVSNASKENATGIESELGKSKWFVNEEGNIKANNESHTIVNSANQDKFKWYINPTFSEGTFSFKIKHSSGKYIPTITTTQDANTTNAVVDEAAAGSYYFMPCIGTGSGFSTNLNGTIFLTVNTSGEDQNIWTWGKTGTSHTGSNLSFPNVTITLGSLQGELNTFKDVEKFDILEGSTVVGPSEFANPEEINAAIDAAKAVNDTEISAIEEFLASTDAQKIKNYLAQKEQYGALYNYQFEVTRQYNTIILPCPSTRPKSITLYSCSAAEEDGYTLTLTEETENFAFNVPYIMESTIGNRYTIIGWDKSSRATHTNGWLTGVLTADGADVPDGSYVLATNKTTGVQGFFMVDGSVTCPQNKCYLTPTISQGVKAFYFNNNGETTGIEGIFGDNNEEKETVIYDLSGRRLNHLQKGVNIVNGHKILVK